MQSTYKSARQQAGSRLASLFALGTALLSTAACVHGVRVLNSPVEANSANNGDTAVAQLTFGPYTTNAVVMVTANGRSVPTEPLSGILVSLIGEDGQILAQDTSFDAVTRRFPYRGATSYTFILPRGATRTIVARTDNTGSGSFSNGNTAISMTAIALAAR